MWPSIRRWRDWLMNDLWPNPRISPQPQALYHSYEKAGLAVVNQPVPWCAEAVLVEGRLRLPPAARRRTDFSLRLGGGEPVPPVDLRGHEGDRVFSLTFRIAPPPGRTTVAELLFRGRVLGQITLPYQSRADFLEGVRLQVPTLAIRLGDQTVACQTFVASQCRGLIATGLLSSPTALVPLLDMDLTAEFRNERGGAPERVAARLASSQLTTRNALVTVVPSRYPRRIGSWLATWWLGDRHLETLRLRAISTPAFARSLRMVDARFLLRAASGEVTLARQVLPSDAPARLGPCFLVASREPGMAGLCRLRVQAQVPGSIQPPVLLEDEVLVTDGPTLFAPGTFGMAELGHVTGFELGYKARVLGQLSLCPAPTASFTSEGGFKPTEEFRWTPAADEELVARLNRLIEGEN